MCVCVGFNGLFCLLVEFVAFIAVLFVCLFVCLYFSVSVAAVHSLFSFVVVTALHCDH